MYAYLRICVCVHMVLFTCVPVHVYVHMYRSVCVCVCVCVCARACECVHATMIHHNQNCLLRIKYNSFVSIRPVLLWPNCSLGDTVKQPSSREHPLSNNTHITEVLQLQAAHGDVQVSGQQELIPLFGLISFETSLILQVGDYLLVV